METNTDPIKAKIIEAVPEIKYRLCRDEYEHHYCPNCDKTIVLPISLADVLRAIEKEQKPYADFIAIDSLGSIYQEDKSKGGEFEQTNIQWNLTTDYAGQTAEVKDFIGKLLGV